MYSSLRRWRQASAKRSVTVTSERLRWPGGGLTIFAVQRVDHCTFTLTPGLALEGAAGAAGDYAVRPGRRRRWLAGLAAEEHCEAQLESMSLKR